MHLVMAEIYDKCVILYRKRTKIRKHGEEIEQRKIDSPNHVYFLLTIPEAMITEAWLKSTTFNQT